MSKATKPQTSERKKVKKIENLTDTKSQISSAFSIIDSNDDSSFQSGVTLRKGAQMALEKKMKTEEESKKKLKQQKCKFLFEQGSCRMGERCYYSHEKQETKIVSAPSRGGRGGMRGGYRGRSMTSSSAISYQNGVQRSRGWGTA